MSIFQRTRDLCSDRAKICTAVPAEVPPPLTVKCLPGGTAIKDQIMPLIAPPNGPTAANKAKAAICILSGVICAATPFVMPLKAEVISLSVLQWYLSVAFGMYGMRAQLARPRRPRPLPSPRVHAHARALSRAHGAPSPTPTPPPRVRPGVQFLLVPRVVIDLNFDVKPDKYHLFMSRARTTCHFAWTTLLSLTRFACTPTLLSSAPSFCTQASWGSSSCGAWPRCG